MSGAEVAGLVLGSIPLLVSGLEHYGEGVRTIKKMTNSSAEFSKLKQTLEVQNQIFLNCLEQLLKDDVDERKLAAMLASVQDKTLWSEPGIDQCLRRRLGRSYDAYFGAVKAMSATMTTFSEALQLNANGKGPFSVDKRSVSDALKRIRFGLKMKAYIELMDTIVAQNQALCQLTHQTSNLEPIRETRRSRVPDFEKARQHARSIFATLQTALLRSCSASHRASLYMKPLEMPRSQHMSKSDRYRVVLHHDLVVTTPPKQIWSIEETEIRLLDEGGDGDDANQVSIQRGVRFQSSGVSSDAKQQQSAKEIQDLCLALQQVRTTSSGCDLCLGYISDVAKKCRHSLYWPEKPMVDKKSAVTTSLAEIFRDKHKLGELDKRLLAAALASGMLRLHATPWLKQQWGKREVILFSKSGNIIAGHPFISAALPSAQAPSAAPVAGEEYFTPCRFIKDETLFALGVLLIEIAFEKSFETLAEPGDLNLDGTKHSLSDFYTADRLIDEVYLKAGDRYGDVVRRCIRCEFDQKKNSLEDPAFRRKVYEGVIAELEGEVDDLMNL